MIFDILDTDIYYINMDSQAERNEEFLSVMSNNGFLTERIHRVSGVPNKYKDALDSHIKALKIGLAGGKPFIIIEDDMKFNQMPPKIELYSIGTPFVSAMSLALSRYGVFDEPNYQGAFHTSINYVKKAEVQHPHISRIFNMIVGNAVYYCDMNYVRDLINHLEFFYRPRIYVSPVTKSIYKGSHNPDYESYIPFDAIMAFMQPTTFFAALKIPAFYHPDGLEPITRFNLTEI
jgi:GR25 family glycosyltransferase involved in LPS biosynthesis